MIKLSIKKSLRQRAKNILLISLGILLAVSAIELILQVFAYVSTKVNSPAQITMFNFEKVKILCVGDSFTYGIGAEKGFSYPEQLQIILNKKQSQKEFEVINCGQPGFNTALSSQKAIEKISSLNPNILIIMTGANDYWNLSGLGKDTDNILLKLNSFMSNFRFYRLIQISMANLNQNNNAFKNDITWIKNKLNPAEIETGLSFLRFVKYARHFKLSHNYEHALVALDQALSLDYFNEHVFELLDELFIDWQDISKAIYYYKKLNEEDSQNIHVNTCLARMYKAVQDYEQSKIYFKKVYDSVPDSAEAAAGIINADFFLRQGITQKFTIISDNYPVICSGNYNLKEIFKQEVELTDEDYSLLKDIVLLLKKGMFINREFLEAIYTRKLQFLADFCKQRKIKVLFLSYPVFVRDYAYQVLKYNNTEFVDLRNTFCQTVNATNKSEYELPDGHCTTKGYGLIAEIVSEHILKDFSEKFPLED